MKNKIRKNLIFILLFVFISSLSFLKAYSLPKAYDPAIEPENSWKRICCSNTKDIEYASDFFDYNNTGFAHNFTEKSYIRFYFYGTKIRILDDYCANRKTGATIYIDDNNGENISSYSTEKTGVYPIYGKENLEKKLHSVDIEIPYEDQKYFTMFYIDLDEDGYITKVKNSLELNEHEICLNSGENHGLNTTVGGTIYKSSDVKWKTSDEEIASVDTNGTVTAHKSGTALITASIDNEDLSDTCTVTVKDVPVLNIEAEKDNFFLNDEVNLTLVIDNIKDIAAEAVKINYDSEKLKFLDMTETDSIKIINKQETEGELKVILACKGKANIINGKKVLLNLKFKALGTGDAIVDVVKGRVSDGISSEEDLREAQCGQANIKINEYDDVNKDGKFSLLDLAIDARHYGENPSDFPQYRTDIVGNGKIDDENLTEICKKIISDPNYNF